MRPKTGIRKHSMSIALTDEEWKDIQEKYNLTTCRSLSEFCRKKLLDRALVVKSRNVSLDQLVNELIRLRNLLRDLGNELSDRAEKCSSVKDSPGMDSCRAHHMTIAGQFLACAAEIKEKIKDIAEQWLFGLSLEKALPLP